MYFSVNTSYKVTMNQVKIGKFIAQCRKEQNITQAELAEKTGIALITIARWETVDIKPQMKAYGKFLAFCEANGIKFE